MTAKSSSPIRRSNRSPMPMSARSRERAPPARKSLRKSAVNALELFARLNLGRCLCFKVLPEEYSPVSGRIVEFAEYLIPELRIEARGLETEGVDPGRMAAALERTGLGVAHELASNPLAPQRVADPEVADEEPAGIGFARKPRDDALPIAGEHGERPPLLMARPFAFVERLQPIRQDLDVRVARRVLDVETHKRGRGHRRSPQ